MLALPSKGTVILKFPRVFPHPYSLTPCQRVFNQEREHVMTDNTPATPNETISENHDLLWKLINTFNQHINELVERKVNEIFQSHATMSLIDEKTEDRIREIADEAVREHESDNDHESRDDISDAIATHIAHTDFTEVIRRSVEEIINDGDYATEERVEELIGEHDFEESVKEVLRNI